MEVKANILFTEYTSHYYQNAISSAYIWNKDKETYAVGLVIIKESDGLKWHSINCAEVRRNEAKKKMIIKLTTSISIRV
jgi:hypothetical protein